MKFFMRLKLPLVSSMTSPRSMSQAVGRQKRSKKKERISCVAFLKGDKVWEPGRIGGGRGSRV